MLFFYLNLTGMTSDILGDENYYGELRLCTEDWANWKLGQH